LSFSLDYLYGVTYLQEKKLSFSLDYLYDVTYLQEKKN